MERWGGTTGGVERYSRRCRPSSTVALGGRAGTSPPPGGEGGKVEVLLVGSQRLLDEGDHAGIQVDLVLRDVTALPDPLPSRWGRKPMMNLDIRAKPLRGACNRLYAFHP